MGITHPHNNSDNNSPEDHAAVLDGQTPLLFDSKTMHKRLFPRQNGFTYGLYYLMTPLGAIEKLADGIRVGVNKAGFLSFQSRDHGDRDGSDLQIWIDRALTQYGLKDVCDGAVYLMTLPRVLGYVFNPVSFWFCLDRQGGLRAVLCEVNNTFGETHSYLCAHDDGRVIDRADTMTADKVFHVSPFLEREGHYTFRFDLRSDKAGIWIDFYDKDGRKKLLTALTGAFIPYSRKSIARMTARYPLITLKAIGLIHWQAVKLLVKTIRYVPKPDQKTERLTRSDKQSQNPNKGKLTKN